MGGRSWWVGAASRWTDAPITVGVRSRSGCNKEKWIGAELWHMGEWLKCVLEMGTNIHNRVETGGVGKTSNNFNNSNGA